MQNKNHLKVLLVLLPFLMFGSLIVFVSLLGSSDIKINRYDAILDINESGDMSVTETWDMFYEGDYRVRFRDINYRKYPSDYPLVMNSDNISYLDEDSVHMRVWKDDVEVTSSLSFGYSFLNDKDELGEPIMCEPYSYTCESLFVDFGSSGAMSGHIVFEYQYTIIGALTKYSDTTELNWKLFDYMEAGIDEAYVTINLPDNAHTRDQFHLFYHGIHEHDVEIYSHRKLTLQVIGLNQDDFLEFRMLAPNTIFPSIPAENTVIDAQMNLSYLLGFEEGLRISYERELATEKNLKLGLLIIAPMMLVIVVVSYFIFDKEHPKYQIDKYLSDLPSDDTPAEIGYLFHMQKVNDEDITATLLDLIRKGFIEIDAFEETTKTPGAGYTLKLVSGADGKTLKSHEKHLLTWFFDRIGHGNYVRTDEIESYGRISYENASAFAQEAKNFVSLVKAQGETNHYFDSKRSSGRKLINLLGLIPLTYALLSVILGSMNNADFAVALMVSLAIGAIYYIYVLGIKRRSIKGHELFLKWSAFKKYLEDFEGLEKYTIPSVETWEHYLVYATTFKIAKKVMDQLKVKIEKVDAMNHSSYQRYYDYGVMTNRFNHVFYTSRSNANKTISAHSSSSSSGGSSGGGGGGGRSR